MITKGDIVNGAYALLRISGVTTNPTPEEISIAIQVLDDYMAELSTSLNTGYEQPLEYGQSDPNDESYLTLEMAGPIKKMLTVELCQFFGKPITPELSAIARSGMRSLEQLLVNVGPAENPATLPIGSGNEYDYRSSKFYREPSSDNGAENKYKTDVFYITIDWRSWLEGLTLSSVEYDTTTGVTVSDVVIEDTVSRGTVSFTGNGQQQVCVRATRDDGLVKTVVYRYDVSECDKIELF